VINEDDESRRFYRCLNEHYDELFPSSPQSVRFLDRRCREGRDEGRPARVLDLACGTGSHAAGLAMLGHDVQGIDIEPAMIARARRHEQCGLGLRFISGDMRNLGRLLVRSQPFDLIYCLGNSIVHLDTRREIRSVLSQSHGLLGRGGRLVVQIVNFDRLLRPLAVEGEVALPKIRSRRGETVLHRSYAAITSNADPQGVGHEDTAVPRSRSVGRKVLFRAQLDVRAPKGKRNSYQIATPLIVLTRGELEGLVEEVGFRNSELFGGFDESPLTADSFPLILTAVRR
jgi:SAM-dependent methyltransferase